MHSFCREAQPEHDLVGGFIRQRECIYVFKLKNYEMVILCSIGLSINMLDTHGNLYL